MKRKLWIALALAALIAALCCGAAAAYESGSLTGSITWSMTDSGELTISGSGMIPDYSIFSKPFSPFDGEDRITEAEIGSGITVIGNNLFYECANLKKVIIGNPDAAISDIFLRNCNDYAVIYGWEGSTAAVYALENDYDFRTIGDLSGTCGDDVTYTFDPVTGTLTISGTGDMPKDLSSSADVPWAALRPYIQSAVINEGVTSICSAAFYGCARLSTVKIPDSVTSIGDAAFEFCSGLTDITIPAGVRRIGKNAFDGCSKLTSVTISNGLRTIGNYAFVDCSSLKSITIPGSVVSIGSFAFKDCSDLGSVTIGNPEAEIGGSGHDVFQGCSSSLVLHGWSLSTAKNYADAAGILFLSLGSLNGYLGDDVTYAFNPHTGRLTISGSGPMWDFDSDLSPLIGNHIIATAVIGSGVTSIGKGAFNQCAGLKSVTIPDSVTIIGKRAFYCCTGLTGIAIPEGVTEINDSTFYECTGLTEVTIPPSVTRIGFNAFSGCTGLTEVAIPEGVITIDRCAFYDCTGLTGIAIPNSVISIDDAAFQGCTGLTSVTIPDSVTSIHDSAFIYCPSLKSIQVAGGNTAYSSADGVLYNKQKTNLITFPGGFTGRYSIPNSVMSIGYCSFLNCTGLTGVTIPDGVTFIGLHAFSGCTGLTSVTIPASVTWINKDAFGSCTNLISASVHNANTKFDQDVFKDAASGFILRGHSGSTAETYAGDNGHPFMLLVEMAAPDFVLPAALTRIEDEAFSGTKMTVAYIPDGVTDLGSGAFANCMSLTQIRIPASVAVIPSDVFGNIGKSQLTIFGAPGSAAQTFAAAEGIRFEAE